MEDIYTVILWCILLIVGYLIGIALSYKKYGKLILEVLDYLKYTKKIEEEEYIYYKEKFLTEKDSLKGLKSIMEKRKKKKNDT